MIESLDREAVERMLKITGEFVGVRVIRLLGPDDPPPGVKIPPSARKWTDAQVRLGRAAVECGIAYSVIHRRTGIPVNTLKNWHSRKNRLPRLTADPVFKAKFEELWK